MCVFFLQWAHRGIFLVSLHVNVFRFLGNLKSDSRRATALAVLIHGTRTRARAELVDKMTPGMYEVRIAIDATRLAHRPKYSRKDAS
jgi:hypothetical protein